MAMTARERVLTALACQEPDRVPVGAIHFNGDIHQRLLRHFGLKPDDHEGLLRALGVEIRGVGAPYTGPRLHADQPERGVHANPEWGIRTRWIAHGTGGYWDYCDFPLREADEEAVANWPMPSPDDYDYAAVTRACQQAPDVALHAGGAGLGDVINTNGMLRGMEQTLVDLATEDPAGLLLIRRRTDIQLEVARRTLEAGRGRIDFLWMGEDLGTQIAPLISRDLYRRVLRPVHQKFVDLARSFGLPVIIHTCGSSSWAYEDFIAMGINAVDTLQPEAANMAPDYLKRTFGGRLAFHGCISTAGPLAYGTAQDTTDVCRHTLETMKPGGGYLFAPTHSVQDNTPTENVVAMYEAVKRYGGY